MGIKNLNKFLNEFPNLVKKVKINEVKGKKIAIDISIILYQVVIAIRNSGADLKNKQGEITSHILGLFNKTIILIKKGIIPIYVFDGKPPSLKNKILLARTMVKKRAMKKLQEVKSPNERIKYFKRIVSITKKQMDQCRELLDYMGIPYIDAPEEADSQCAYLAKKGYVDGVLTEDMDILTFGAHKIYRHLASYKKESKEISLHNILDKLNLTYEQFVEFCILMGCDYCEGLTDVKPNIIYKYYLEHLNIPDTLESLQNVGYKIPRQLNYLKAKQYFLNPNVINVNKLQLNIVKINPCKLINLLVNRYGLIKFKIKWKVNILVSFCPNNILV